MYIYIVQVEKSKEPCSRPSSREIAYPDVKEAAATESVSCLEALAIKDASARKDRVVVVEIFIPADKGGSYGAFNAVIKVSSVSRGGGGGGGGGAACYMVYV